MSDSTAYLDGVRLISSNPDQQAAFDATDHCVVVAGPGSGKTATLTLKMAKVLKEEIQPPRGVACITYNNECAIELETRLRRLGVRQDSRVFIGTVHSFSLTQILLPYAKPAKLDIPPDFSVATQAEQRTCFERAFENVIGGHGDPTNFRLPMDRYRRSFTNRNSQEWAETDPETARLIEEYERQLRLEGLIDFDDMPLLALGALRENEWIRKAVLAKYPMFFVDEYQDLGLALHRMVVGMCFSVGARLFAVGDADQSIYGFTGANPSLLNSLADREDVTAVRLKKNYRSGSRILKASESALGESRSYTSRDDAPEGQIFIHALRGNYQSQANHLFQEVLPQIQARNPTVELSDIGVLYPAAWIGDAVANAATNHGITTIRSDGNSLYPRSSRIMRWIEQCAAWGAYGWQSKSIQFTDLVETGYRIFFEHLSSPEDRREFRQGLFRFLWEHREPGLYLSEWLGEFDRQILKSILDDSSSLRDEQAQFQDLVTTVTTDNEYKEYSLGNFAGFSGERDRLSLSTLHSAKGREFAIVILFGIDQGRIPRNGATARQAKEARRLFYVGVTRAELEVHVVHSKNNPSRFVRDIEAGEQ